MKVGLQLDGHALLGRLTVVGTVHVPVIVSEIELIFTAALTAGIGQTVPVLKNARVFTRFLVVLLSGSLRSIRGQREQILRGAFAEGGKRGGRGRFAKLGYIRRAKHYILASAGWCNDPFKIVSLGLGQRSRHKRHLTINAGVGVNGGKRDVVSKRLTLQVWLLGCGHAATEHLGGSRSGRSSCRHRGRGRY